MVIVLTGSNDFAGPIVMHACCARCGRPVSIEYVPDDRSQGPTAWTCPESSCLRPNLMTAVREIRAVWSGHGERPRIRRSTA